MIRQMENLAIFGHPFCSMILFHRFHHVKNLHTCKSLAHSKSCLCLQSQILISFLSMTHCIVSHVVHDTHNKFRVTTIFEKSHQVTNNKNHV